MAVRDDPSPPASAGHPAAAVVNEPGELGRLAGDWDALAIEARAPFGAPAWALAWWHHLAPAGARLAVVAVRSGAELVGLAPFYAVRRLGLTELRLLSGGFASRPGILARPGRESEVAAAVAATLAGRRQRPDAIHWQAVDRGAGWPERLSAAWPGGGHRLLGEGERSAPVVHLDPAAGFEEWLAGKSRNFRSQMRRRRREIEERGARLRCADRASLGEDLAAFARLHAARWEARGGSGAVDGAALRMLREVGEELVASGRLRLWMIDGPGGEAVSAQVFVAAGGEVAYWNGGFDERWGDCSPGLLGILAAIEDALDRGERILDLGGGEAAYKDRLASEDRPVTWSTSYPPGARQALARARRLPGRAARRGARDLRELLGPARYNRLRRLLDRRPS